MKNFTLIILLSIFSLNSFSQKVTIFDLESKENFLNVEFSFRIELDKKYGIKKHEANYFIIPEIYYLHDNKNKKISNAKSFSGSLKNIGEGAYTISWDYYKDNVFTPDKYGYSMTLRKYNLLKTTLMSAAIPGSGICYMTKKKKWLILGGISYAGVASSYIYWRKSRDMYNSYLNTKNDYNLRKTYYEKYEQKVDNANKFLLSSICLTGANILFTAILNHNYYKNNL